MRITFLCQYFPPEMGAPAARTFEHARHWAALGHDVTVITAFPNHPTGIIRPEYRGQFVKRENVEGIDLLRTWVYCAANKGFFRRVLNFLSFFCSSLILGGLLTRRPDVVIGTSPQFFCAVAAYLLSRLKGVPFVFEVRDIWPQSAIELGVLKNRRLIRVLEAIELHLYRHAALIVPVAESTREYLLGKGVAPEKIKIIPNGVDERYLAANDPTPQQVREQLGLQGKFIVSYIGTHGMSHALDVVLRAAQQFGEDSGVHFLFIGEGAEKDKLKRLAEELRLRNVTFLNEQSRDRLPGFYRAADVSLVPLKRLPIFKKVLPSKLFELMGTGCPVICGVEGEAARLVTNAEAGLCIEPESADALAAAIQRLRSDANLRKQMSACGQRFVRAHYLRSTLAEKYLDVIEPVIGERWTGGEAQAPMLRFQPTTEPSQQATERRPPTTEI
ncbi:MAG TPA: glycosyltransferase family 4 protein [Blastocatellia bacterium]|nr:glycosyltransferase family 4 protein [Blastocatellia bacterium]HMV82069.1 glycosyltransferase family 4 protein [Blastocatellia bacterium]HMX28923.1 glycosyltransferase family 4 protein [Blastocatellia bacterium]HMY73180.1 glycosyltransferase family 4 protein [Blastocatellia bacterium]HMZ17914.1 glycosyltransferase family 4 protein [Blastocatellia bacterium]